jgi:NADH-quinone oxidoreductase subunit J
MTGLQLLFLLNGIVVVFSAILCVTARRMIHAALWFVLALLGVAVVFATLEASFFAVVQVLIYIGAIAILIIFAVMLTRRTLEDQDKPFNRAKLTTFIVTAVILAGMVFSIREWLPLNTTTVPLSPDQADLGTLGLALIDPAQFALPFELTSVLLLAALIGSIYIAYERREERK